MDPHPSLDRPGTGEVAVVGVLGDGEDARCHMIDRGIGEHAFAAVGHEGDLVGQGTLTGSMVWGDDQAIVP